MRCQTAQLYRKQRQLPLSKRIIAPTQRRRRPPVLDWASSAAPRADKRAQMRTASSPNWLTNISVARNLPWSPAHWTRYAMLSSTARLKLAHMPQARRAPQAQHSPASLLTNLPNRKTKPAKQPPTNARPQLREQQPHAPLYPPGRSTHRGSLRRNDCVARRADFCPLSFHFMRHRVRRRWREWERIGTSGQVIH
jgi:hypothetical protein